MQQFGQTGSTLIFLQNMLQRNIKSYLENVEIQAIKLKKLSLRAISN